MKTATLRITCRDPIVARDGRPFGSTGGARGNRMRAVGWPSPSVVAGSLRTTLGKAAAKAFSDATAKELLEVTVAGLFPAVDRSLYLPAPSDCVVDPANKALRVCPKEEQGGCDWPARGLAPVMLAADDGADDFKPKEGPAWWPVDRYAAWLTGQPISFDHTFLNAPETEDRTHVQLRPETGAAEEGMLFTTAALPLTHLRRFDSKATDLFADRFAEISLMTRVAARAWVAEAAENLSRLHPLGGERRLVHWQTTTRDIWDTPKVVESALATSSHVRMTLATPAIFSGGWKPGWLNDQLTGSPWQDGPTLKLVGVCIQRWRAVSGWSLAALPGQGRGPKPVKRMVPAGGVYFFELVDGAAQRLASRWLQPVSDDEQDRRDGFGLAAWGTW